MVTSEKKYVNMADVIYDKYKSPAKTYCGQMADLPAAELVELLFFAYRDFISEPDEILSAYGFGRAHHRVLHFVGRNPGLRVSRLLDILRITKQSLGRVLRELIETGYICQHEGPNDRRQRLLFLTGKGIELHKQLMAPQMERVERALARAGADSGFRDVLLELINREDRSQVLALTGGPDKG